MRIISLILFISIQFAQTPKDIKEKGNTLYQEAYGALKDGKNQESIKLFKQFLELRPNYINAYFFLAKLYATSNDFDTAISYLNKIADMKMDLNPANFEDPDLKKIPLVSIEKVKAKFAMNKNQIGKADIAFQLDEKDLISESVAINSKSGISYISSVHKRKIIKRNSTGLVSTFSDSTDGLWAVFSLKISLDKKFLWASSSATKEMIGFNESIKNKAGLFKFDLETGVSEKSYILAEDQNEHIWGDFIFSKTGEIYISDSSDNTVYVLNTETGVFRKLIESNYFSSLQGLTFNSDESILYVADYSEGIYAINLNSKQVNKVGVPDHIVIRGLDGLYWYNNSLIATQNGFKPNRVIQLHLNTKQDRITSYKTLIANHELIDDPTLGTIIGNQFYFIANSQWSAIKRDGSMKPLAELNKPTILKLGID